MNGKRITEANDGLRLYTDNVANYLTLLRPSSLAANASITLPTLSGEILTGVQAFQTAADSFTSDTTLAPLSGMSVALEAGATYQIEVLLLGTNGAGDVKTQFDAPAGATVNQLAAKIQSGGNGSIGNTNYGSGVGLTAGSPDDWSSVMSAGGFILQYFANITTVAAGNVVIQGAQNSLSATPTVYSLGGYIKATRIS